MNNNGLEKSKHLNIKKIINYAPHSILSKTIIKKITGKITVTSYDAGESSTERISRFDNFIQIIDGKAEIVINGLTQMLNKGDSIIIPANSANTINAVGRFKMISTIIKSGYEDVI
jgi:quercetin dioxygenase-like cupin family protein